MKKIVFIGGPTASGKTSLAVELAKKFNGELINADSRQIYKYLDIGTNKGEIISKNDQNFIDDIPIHMIGFLNPDERYNVFEFKQEAIKLVNQIIEKGKLPIIVGGTGLYIDSIIKDYSLSGERNADLRHELEKLGVEELRNILINEHKAEFEGLNQSDKSNPQRLVRLIEKLKSPTKYSSKFNDFEYIFLYPKYDWDLLVQKINDRVEQMFKDGIIEEVQKVLSLGFSKDSAALKGTGYKEILMLLDGIINLQRCIELVKISHRQYAKRQKTWFEGKGRGYNLIKTENTEQAIEKVKEFYDTNK